MNILKKATFATALAASALTAASPAMARDHYGYRHHGDSTGAAMGIVTRSSAALIAAAGRPDPSPPTSRRTEPPRCAWSGACPLRGTEATMRQP